jgi:hypothetical protein
LVNEQFAIENGLFIDDWWWFTWNSRWFMLRMVIDCWFTHYKTVYLP